MLMSVWWESLSELSRPEWHSPSGGYPSSEFRFEFAQKDLHPTSTTLEFIGKSVASAWVRWWKVRGKTPIRSLVNWSRVENWLLGTTSTPKPNQFSQLRRLVELAAEQQHPIWVEGNPNLAENAQDSTEFWEGPRMLTWVIASKSRRGVLEVGFDSDRNGISSQDREAYLRALHGLRDELIRRMISVPELLSPSPLSFLENARSHSKAAHSSTNSAAALAELASILEMDRTETIRKIERQLEMLAGTRLDTLEDNQMIAKYLQRLLDSHGFRVRCPECGEPAVMRCLASGNTLSGSFVFDHVLSQGRTFHGGRSAIPKLEVVSKPIRKTSPLS